MTDLICGEDINIDTFVPTKKLSSLYEAVF